MNLTPRRNPDHRIETIAAMAVPLTGKAPAPHDFTGLWYRQPAAEWLEALPLGNGRLGAMVYGGVKREYLQLNEESLWTGEPIERDRQGTIEVLNRARELFRAGKNMEGETLIQESFMGRRIEKGLHTYQTLGDLRLDFPDHTEAAGYRRELDLERAIARVGYTVGKTEYMREMFVSAPDNVLVMRIGRAGDQDASGTSDTLTFTATLERSAGEDTGEKIRMIHTDRPAELMMSGRARALDSLIEEHGQESARSGVRYAARLRITTEGGTISTDNGIIRVEGADSALVILAAATDYQGGDPEEATEEHLRKAAGFSFEALRKRHIYEYSKLFGRVSLRFGNDEIDEIKTPDETSTNTRAATPEAPEESSPTPTDRRHEAFAEGADDPDLISLYFQYGRYLLISSSRPGGLPANLQGIWADGFVPPWNADYHININIQMNYWPAWTTGLIECQEPFLAFIDSLRERGREVARDVFGCRGFTAGHTTDAWRYAGIIGRVRFGMWPMGAVWCACHFWQHYLFTGDKEFLTTIAYPVMKEASEFLLDWLSENPETGLLESGPSTSPENAYIVPGSGETACLSMGPTMDHEIISDLSMQSFKRVSYSRPIRNTSTRYGRVSHVSHPSA